MTPGEVCDALRLGGSALGLASIASHLAGGVLGKKRDACVNLQGLLAEERHSLPAAGAGFPKGSSRLEACRSCLHAQGAA